MKPMNFPERVNQRRKEALERMTKSGKKYKDRERDEKALRGKIVLNAANKFTKKTRAAKLR